MSFDPSNFDPNAHSDGGGDLVPPGEYVLMIRNFTRQFRKGKDQIDFTLRAVLNKDKRKMSGDYGPIWETATLTENAIWRFANLCKAIGQTDPFNVNDDAELASVVKGKPFKARIVHETYNGRKSAKIKNYLELKDADVKAFEEVLEDMAMDEATGGYSGGPGSGSDDYQGNQGTQSSDYTDEDIPF